MGSTAAVWASAVAGFEGRLQRQAPVGDGHRPPRLPPRTYWPSSSLFRRRWAISHSCAWAAIAACRSAVAARSFAHWGQQTVPPRACGKGRLHTSHRTVPATFASGRRRGRAARRCPLTYAQGQHSSSFPACCTLLASCKNSVCRWASPNGDRSVMQVSLLTGCPS